MCKQVYQLRKLAVLGTPKLHKKGKTLRAYMPPPPTCTRLFQNPVSALDWNRMVSNLKYFVFRQICNDCDAWCLKAFPSQARCNACRHSPCKLCASKHTGITDK